MEHSEQPRHGPRERIDSLAETPTHLITLSPAFLDALRKIAPKARPRKARYLLVLAAVVSVGWVFAHRMVARSAALVSVGPVSAATSADAVTTSPGASAASAAAASASVSVQSAPTGPASTATSVDDLPRAQAPKPPKVTKHRTKQVPR